MSIENIALVFTCVISLVALYNSWLANRNIKRAMYTLSRSDKYYWMSMATHLLSEEINAPADRVAEYVAEHVHSLGNNWNYQTPQEFVKSTKKMGLKFYDNNW